jgi:hypothetical protein
VNRAQLADALNDHQWCTDPAYEHDLRTPHSSGPSGISRLARRLSDGLGDQAWRQSGLGAPADIDQLTARITELEQRNTSLRLDLDEKADWAPPPGLTLRHRREIHRQIVPGQSRRP